VRNVENSYHPNHYTLKNSLTLRLSGWWNKLELELQPAFGIHNERLEYERGDKRFEPQRNRPYASLHTYLKYKFTKQNYIQFTYGGTTRRPYLMLLLPVTYTGNPMEEVVNNPGLKTGWDNRFDLRAYRFNTKRGDSYNGYLNDDRYYEMELLNDFYASTEPIELLNHVFYGRDDDTCTTDANGNESYGEFNPNREYFYYNGYGNLVSSNYKDYSAHLDKYVIESMLDYREHIDTIDDNDDLNKLFDELEQIIMEE
jgi:hypothetical protein